jgi:hypothetical protein
MNAQQWDALAAVLRSAQFPANRQDLINHARAQGAADDAVARLQDLPIAVYRNLVDVRDAASELPAA